MKFGGVAMRDYIASGKYSKNDFAPYIAPEKNDLIEAGRGSLFGGLKWDPQECYYYSVENTVFANQLGLREHIQSIVVSMTRLTHLLFHNIN